MAHPDENGPGAEGRRRAPSSPSKGTSLTTAPVDPQLKEEIEPRARAALAKFSTTT